MSPKPKTVEEWREKRREKYRNSGDKGGFRVLPIKVLESDAFNELSKSGKIVLIISLSQLDYWVKKNHKGLPKRETSIGPLRNDGCFSLPSNLLKERGIKGTDTIARVRKELIEAGFWETVQTGSLYNTGVFRWSDNWLLYNQKKAAERKQQKQTSRPAGYCHYPNIMKYNDIRRAAKPGNTLPSLRKKDAVPALHHDQDSYKQVELFPAQTA
jgi:hypothetical protein